jgi:HemY protein
MCMRASGDSTHDRLIRAKKLAALRPHHVESSLVVARAALEASEFSEARKAIEAALRQEPREGIYLLLADLEEAETADEGRVRQWLSRAVRAPRDPAWVADGYVSDKWAPASPVTGRLDAFEWRMPVERLGQIVEAGDDIEPSVMAAIAAPPAKPVEPVEADAIIEAELAPKEPKEEDTETATDTTDTAPRRSRIRFRTGKKRFPPNRSSQRRSTPKWRSAMASSKGRLRKRRASRPTLWTRRPCRARQTIRASTPM